MKLAKRAYEFWQSCRVFAAIGKFSLVIAGSPTGDESNPVIPVKKAGLLRFRLRAPRSRLREARP